MSAAAKNRRTVLGVVGVIAAMGALTSYAPTLYRLFCEATGYLGTTQRAAAAPAAGAAATTRTILIRFTAERHPDLPWRFAPAEREMRVRIGDQHLAHYVAENRAAEGVTGMAVFNVAPVKAGQYFNKIACFCFEEQYLAPGQRVDMPVSFFVDPAILEDRNLDDVSVITLSYTFYRAEKPKRQAAAPAGN